MKTSIPWGKKEDEREKDHCQRETGGVSKKKRKGG